MLYSAQITTSVENSADLLGVDFATQFYFESPAWAFEVEGRKEAQDRGIETKESPTGRVRAGEQRG